MFASVINFWKEKAFEKITFKIKKGVQKMLFSNKMIFNIFQHTESPKIRKKIKSFFFIYSVFLWLFLLSRSGHFFC